MPADLFWRRLNRNNESDGKLHYLDQEALPWYFINNIGLVYDKRYWAHGHSFYRIAKEANTKPCKEWGFRLIRTKGYRGNRLRAVQAYQNAVRGQIFTSYSADSVNGRIWTESNAIAVWDGPIHDRLRTDPLFQECVFELLKRFNLEKEKTIFHLVQTHPSSRKEAIEENTRQYWTYDELMANQWLHSKTGYQVCTAKVRLSMDLHAKKAMLPKGWAAEAARIAAESKNSLIPSGAYV